MKYIVETDKSVPDAIASLESAIAKHQYGVLHTHNLRQTLQKKGHELGSECFVLEVCNPKQAVAVLREDISMNMALPCRVSVYQASGKTMIGTILPSAILGMLSTASGLKDIARTVENDLKQIIDESK